MRIYKRSLMLLVALLLHMPFDAAAQAPNTPVLYVSGEELKTVKGSSPTGADIEKANGGKKPSFYCSKNPLSIDSNGALPIDSLERCESVRRISAVADRVVVTRIALTTGTCDKPDGSELELTFSEKKRSTFFGEGLKRIFKFLVNKEKSLTAAKASWCLIPHEHVLQLDRALVTISAKYAGADAEQVATAQLITGSEEHLFLSGDAIVRGANEVKWDSATQTLVAKDKPNQLYLGFNYMVGDIFASHDARSWNRVVFKVMFQPAKKPFDSIGIGIGYRFADGVFHWNEAHENGGFMAFGGVFWTRSDALGANNAVIGGGRERSIRVGVSYSLDKLLDWIK